MDRRALLLALAAAAAAPAAARAGEKKEETAPPLATYMPMAVLTAYTNKPNGRRGVMTVDCGLDVPNPDLHTRADQLLPRLRAAYVEAVQAYAGGLPAGYPPNVDYIARSLQRRTDEILGRPGARVLLGAVVLN